MDTQDSHPKIDFKEFQKVSERFFSAMDQIVAQHGYEKLTPLNVSNQAKLPEESIQRYFNSFEMLCKMYDHYVVLNQQLRLASGQTKLD
ncbi:hypothetical protein ACFQZX_17820 [Mucilaginibacter litoreus]|uniref:HTH tetR-type domain-containing protein n=1 Tax=Mucilaginibacter litoreus TaxID=1048221 RepID=A0ABW3AX53_9SPHI